MAPQIVSGPRCLAFPLLLVLTTYSSSAIAFSPASMLASSRALAAARPLALAASRLGSGTGPILYGRRRGFNVMPRPWSRNRCGLGPLSPHFFMRMLAEPLILHFETHTGLPITSRQEAKQEQRDVQTLLDALLKGSLMV